jgi:hypothetical protein
VTAPRRSAPDSTGRRVALVVLVTGSVLALLSTLGPGWLARAGVGVAVAVAVASHLLAWTELRAERRRHAQAMLRLLQAHGAALREERRHNAAVVATLGGRAREAAATIETQQLTIGELHVEVATLEGRTIQLRSEARRRETALAELRRVVTDREAEVQALRLAAEAGGAEGGRVRSLPRRSRHEEDEVVAAKARTPAHENELRRDRHSTTADLTSAELAVSLPNFEADRRWA